MVIVGAGLAGLFSAQPPGGTPLRMTVIDHRNVALFMHSSQFGDLRTTVGRACLHLLKVRIGSGTEIPCVPGTSGSMRLAVFETRS